MRTLKMGALGLGQGASWSLLSMDAMPEIELVAGADLNAAMRSGFSDHFPAARTYATAEELFRDPNVDAIWIGTPNRLHCEHAVEAMRNGKHVVVEKPMAVTLEDADRMVEASEKYGVILLAGHTRSLSIWNRAMRRIVLSGEIGAIRAIHIWSYTDWILRPRTPDELDPQQGGGIVFRQGPHQIDTLRLLGGGMLRSVRGMAGRWTDSRPIPGYYTAYLEFEDGTASTIMHNGYGYFGMPTVFPWAPEDRGHGEPERVVMRRELEAKLRDELKEKEDYRVGGRSDPVAIAKRENPIPYPWIPVDLGPVEVACERGLIMPAQWGVTVYDDDGHRTIDLTHLQRPEPDPSGGLTISILEELYAAVVHGKRAYHTGEWGRATLEAVLAVMQSARERREIVLTRQVPMPDEYDADMLLEAGANAR